MNEEEIRSKLLMPFLNDLGFNPSEISLEKHFSIRLGKSQQIIKGRSDILCKRNGENLFIIELKNDSIAITKNDINQGISYARLLDNIAPFTIITNGKTTRIFDSITSEELTGSQISKKSNFWMNGCTLSTDLDLKIRYEALKNFISFSSENLKFFCESQVSRRMKPITGDIDDHYSKFVKKLYVQRKGLQQTFDNFICSEASMFAIIGSAGVGKTNVMCALALQKLEDNFVFFYNAAIIDKSPIEHIAQDLNGTFSSKNESYNMLKKLDEIGRHSNKIVIIFIDGIDENIHSNIAFELSEIALAVESLKHIKICISCKSSVWSSILKQNGTKTHLFDELNKFHDLILSIDSCPGFLLEDFSDLEIKTIIPVYRKIFKFKGEISDSIYKALKNGFFLRIFCEVYNDKQIPEEINDKDLIRSYVQQSLEKTKISTLKGLRILSKIGRILVEHKYSGIEVFHDSGLEIEGLIENLEFSLDENILEDLFARNILVKSSNQDSYNVSFYYSKIRDFIICYHSYKLNNLDDNDFYKCLEFFYENHIGQSAISFYIENAEENHKRILAKFKKDKSVQYVNNYDQYLKQHFLNCKDKFDPGTNGDIGILLSETPIGNNGYALFPIDSDSSSKISYNKIEDPLSGPLDLFVEKNIKVFHSNISPLLIADQNKTIRQYVFKQLKEIIEKGRLPVYSSDILLLEQVSAILYYYSKKLGYNFVIKDLYYPRYELIYPINLVDLKDRVHKFLVTEFFSRRNIDQQLKNKKINDFLASNDPVPKLNIKGDFPPFEELYKIVEILIGRGYTKVHKHYLPYPDISVKEVEILCDDQSIRDMSKIRALQFSEMQAKKYIEAFFKNFESAYKDLVEFCFPTLKDNFPFYKSMPHEYFLYMVGCDVFKWGWVGFQHSSDGEFRITHEKLRTSEELFPTQVPVLHSFSFGNILHSSYLDVVKTIDKINTPKVDKVCVIKNYIYQFLQRDLENFFKQIKQA